jgi:predicted membrane channel-forming protein YqfA (hemolysin III family)
MFSLTVSEGVLIFPTMIYLVAGKPFMSCEKNSAILLLICVVFYVLPDKYPSKFFDLFHTLDVWHKSVKLAKKLAKVGRWWIQKSERCT